MATAYLVARISIYLLIGYVAFFYKSYQNKIDKLILLIVGLGAITDLLDKTIIGSNLELYAIYKLAVLGILGILVYSDIKSYTISIICGSVLLVSTVFAFLSDFSFDLIVFDNVYYSEYGWLNTNQSTQLAMLASLLIVILVFHWMYKFISSRSTTDKTKHLFFAFGILSNFGLSFILKVFDRLLYDNYNDFVTTSYIVLISSFFIEHILIILGLKWKQ